MIKKMASVKKITLGEKQKIISLIKLFPKKISVTIHRSEDGGFYAELNDFDGCVTEGDTLSELIEMINDCLRTYFDVPLKYLQFMPSYLPSVGLAQEFNIFPADDGIKEKTVKFVK
jgi:predicted RNase H-like HicB family nuclease